VGKGGFTKDNGYLAALSASQRNRQVAVWLRAVGGRVLFHDADGPRRQARDTFIAEADRAERSAFAAPLVEPSGAE
jgi:hypothetical protein